MTTVRCSRLAGAVAVALAAAPVLTCGPACAQVKWNLLSAYPADNFHSQNLEAFAKDLAEATGGRLLIRVYPNASLHPASAIKTAVRIGQAIMGGECVEWMPCRSGRPDITRRATCGRYRSR